MNWEYAGIDADYPFEIPGIPCCNLNGLAYALGAKLNTFKRWERNGDIPTRSQSAVGTLGHDNFWTGDEAKEVFIKAMFLLRKEGKCNE